MLPCLIFEDDHLLVVNKATGRNTHAPHPYAGEGLYDWLRHRLPRWANLAIIHRLDKETSGVLVFSKTSLANRSLTKQFATRRVTKKYVFLTDRMVPKDEWTVRSWIVRAGEKYLSRPKRTGGESAETRFRIDRHGSFAGRDATLVEAQPLTGRTHQIRVHASESGFPILGDVLYGGTPAIRVYLHAAEIEFEHPVTGQRLRLKAPVDFESDPRVAYRAALLDPKLTSAYRLIHGASDGWPAWYVERLGQYILSESQEPLTGPQREELSRLMHLFSASAAYHKISPRRKTTSSLASASPQLAIGQPAPPRFLVAENGLEYELSFSEGASPGLFLDQRDNRYRLLQRHIAAEFEVGPVAQASHPVELASEKLDCPWEVLNAFSYTCGFSVCAAKAGAQTVSVDLSKKYLDWGRRNFSLNQLEPNRHEFICGEVFDWMRRFRKKGRQFDVLLLDPPTFSQSKESGVFRAERDYGKLVSAALPLLKPGGILFASSNAATLRAEDFLATVMQSVHSAGLEVVQKQYFPQPPDFPISRSEQAYLKTVWLRVGAKG